MLTEPPLYAADVDIPDVAATRDSTDTVAVHRVEPDDAATIDLIAQRMRLTLVEVLDETRADEMFDHPALLERVRWHLDRSDPDRRAEVFVALLDGDVVGHTMLRVDDVDGERLGLFATTYVTPPARRAGAASALLLAGERWMRAQGMTVAATFTDARNDRLLAFYAAHGYECRQLDQEWATARRVLE